MKIEHMLMIGRFVKEGLSYFIRLPLIMKVYGTGGAAAIWLFLIWMRLRRKERLKAVSEAFLAVLILYLVLVFIITTFSRNPLAVRSFSLKLFYTIRLAAAGSIFYAKMLFFNLILLVPLGILLPVILEYRCGCKDILFLAFLISLSIECTQFLFRLGYLEADDLLHNCLGALAGYCLIRLFHSTAKFFGRSRPHAPDLQRPDGKDVNL